MDNDELEKILDEVGDPLPASDAPIDITKIEPPIIEEPITPTAVVPAPPAPPPVAQSAPSDPAQIDATQLLKQYLSVYEKFLNNYDSDRAQIEKTIKHLEDIVFNFPGAPRVNLEMLVAAQRTKAETNGNIVKALDSIAKILAAAKGTQVLINNNNSSGTQMDLAKILSQPLYPDEMRKTSIL
jgi:hypothetical protein